MRLLRFGLILASTAMASLPDLPLQFGPFLARTFHRSRKWYDLSIGMPGVDYELENVNIMVPGITKEFGTFSIFQRRAGSTHFLVVDNGEHGFVDFDQLLEPKDRTKLINTVDRAVFSFVDHYGFVDVYLPTEIITHAEDRQAFNDAFGPPRPPAFMANMSKFVHPKPKKIDATKTISATLKKRLLSTDQVDIPPSYGSCKCTGRDDVITAEKCLTDNSKCVPCSPGAARDICGYDHIEYGECVTVDECGVGVHQVNVCYRFWDEERNGNNQCEARGEVETCEVPCYGECQCASASDDNVIKAEQCSLSDPSDCIECTDLATVEAACGVYTGPVEGECSTTCGDNGVMTVTQCFIWNDSTKSPLCTTQEQPCPDVSPCPVQYASCTCTESRDPLNLTAEECNINDPSDCRPCDTGVCGQFTQPVAGPCSVTCGQGGQQTVQKCFVWDNGAPTTCTQETQSCDSGVKCQYVCTCQSDRPSDQPLLAKWCDTATGECLDECDGAVCGDWDQWADWTECTVTCGGGSQSRKRCFKWNDPTKDDYCETSTQECNEKTCPGWGEWSGWDLCEAKCRNEGEPTPKQIKYRCWNNGEGEQCERNACGRTWCQQNKERDCRNLPVCTTGPCTWSDWGEWGACSANCKDGIKLRRRTGTDGATCEGSNIEQATCSEFTNECASCTNVYDRCEMIKGYCTHRSYQATLKQQCAATCGHCDDDEDRRKRRDTNPIADFMLLDEQLEQI